MMAARRPVQTAAMSLASIAAFLHNLGCLVQASCKPTSKTIAVQTFYIRSDCSLVYKVPHNKQLPGLTYLDALHNGQQQGTTHQGSMAAVVAEELLAGQDAAMNWLVCSCPAAKPQNRFESRQELSGLGLLS